METEQRGVKRAFICVDEPIILDTPIGLTQRDSGDFDEETIANRAGPVAANRDELISFSSPSSCPTFKNPNSIGLSEERGKKQATKEERFSLCKMKTSCGIIDAVKHDCGDFVEVMLYDGLIVNKPGFVVVAGAGIPDELKIKDGISFRFPSPYLKVCKDRHQVTTAAGEENEEPTFMSPFEEAMKRAYRKALGIRLDSDLLEEEKEKAHRKEKLFTMIMVNVSLYGGYIFQLAKEGMINGYSISSVEGRDGGIVKVLQWDTAYYVRMLHYKGVLINKPGSIVVAAGGIPDELKITGGISLSYRSPTMRIRKDVVFDPAKRRKAIRDAAYKEVWGPDALKRNIIKAQNSKALLSSMPEQLKNMLPPPPAIIEVNFLLPGGHGSQLDQLDKDINMEELSDVLRCLL